MRLLVELRTEEREREGIEIVRGNGIEIGTEKEGEWRGIWRIRNERTNREVHKSIPLFLPPKLALLKIK